MFEQITEEQGERHAIEAVTDFDGELAIERERQINDGSKHHHAEDQGESVGEAVKTRCPEVMQPGESATERQGEQQRGVDQGCQNGQLVAVDRVIGRFLVGGQRNAFGEPGRDGGTMRGDMTDLAQRQPQPAGERQPEYCQKHEGKVGGHETGCEAMRKCGFSRSWAII